ncbi:MAG: MarR family transcriptional regulator [Chloroflexi bacterium]|nr:MarR family transcriptional regulator [Chloroflexota bacterium]
MIKGPIDFVQQEWRRERPDLDPSPIGVFGRASRVTRLAENHGKALLRKLGLRPWEYEMLATLRRSHPDEGLTPTELGEALLASSGTLTNRIDQLERAGLVERHDHPDDRRALLVKLTEEGRTHVDRAVEAYLTKEHELLETLTRRERKSLEGLLRKLLMSMDPSVSGG